MNHQGRRIPTVLDTSLRAALPALGWLARLLCAACLQWPVAHADAPLPSARALGLSESMVNYCESRDPAAAEKLRRKIRQLVQGASPQQLAEVRNSDEYRKAYDAVVEFAAKIDEHNVKKFCAETPTGH